MVLRVTSALLQRIRVTVVTIKEKAKIDRITTEDKSDELNIQVHKLVFF